ncbi:M48 family metallopeptidase [Stutzerimonas azotifigens]|uniref:M48 family metallopeptidase n=1 Tax=Stutzerimonas azotifigens TaxID=291995 RepID=UPI0004238710|nr:M48 family metallopeptidase [Stutzerimonas azotifigens]
MKFRLVLTGRAAQGCSNETIRQRLVGQMKLSAAQAETLLPPAVRVLKQGLDRPGAEALRKRFAAVGLDTRIEAFEPAPAADPLQPLQALAQAGLKRSPPSRRYVTHLLLVTLCCLLIPALYAGLVIGLAVALGWYLGHVHVYLASTHGIWLKLCAYAIPAISGGVLLLFLARPLFSGRAPDERALVLDLDTEPRLRQVIDQLCQAIGLQPPVAVHLSGQVNASVHFEGGWRGFRSGRKVLTIGLPLVAGLTVQQFTGVLAHEFGHFAQRLGMRCSFLINRVNAWLEVRGYTADPWDDRLDEWMERDLWFPVALALQIGQFGIDLSRRLMQGCFWLSFRLSRSLSRQMEFDADRYEALLSGSGVFRQTALRLRTLSEAWQEVDRQNGRIWRERRLLRDMPEATALMVARLDRQVLQAIEQSLEERTTRYWDTHPADLERIHHSEALKAPGHVHDTRPAATLFTRFAEHCERVTLAYYTDLGLDYQGAQLQDSHTLLQLNDQREQALDQLQEWSGRQWRAEPWLPLHQPALPAHTELGWQAIVDTLRQQSPEIIGAWQTAEQEQEQRVALAYCLSWHRRGEKAWLSDREPIVPEKHEPLYRQIEKGQTPAQQQLAQAASLYRRRLEFTLARGNEAARTAGRLLLQLSALFPDYARLVEARELARRFTLDYRRQGDNHSDQLSHDALVRYQDLALRLLAKADGIAQPFLDGDTLGGYLRLRCPHLKGEPGEPMDFFENSGTLVDSLAYMHARVAAEVASACLAIERAQGIRGIRLLAKAAGAAVEGASPAKVPATADNA